MQLLEVPAWTQRPARVAYVATLDAKEPYLDDHRPGGHPLFGTVMGIELMVRAAFGLAQTPIPENWAVTNVVVGEPLILNAETAEVFAVAKWEIDGSQSAIHCVVESQYGTKQSVRHFEASLFLHSPCLSCTSAPGAIERPDFKGNQSVLLEDVYALYFHGPAYRVINQAWFDGEAIRCELNRHLPGLTRARFNFSQVNTNRDPAANPQWVELGLQAAGLLEIALNSRMMIPERMKKIEYFAASQSKVIGGIFAIARRAQPTLSGLGSPDGVDIELVNLSGDLLMRISNYQTCPLPFAMASSSVEKLARKFSRL